MNYKRIAELEARLEKAEALAAKYREALEWYADQSKVICRYDPGAKDGIMGPTAPIYEADDGKRARAALAEGEGTP